MSPTHAGQAATQIARFALAAIGAGDATLLSVVIVTHIAAGLTAAICGATAMLSPKRAGRHPAAGRCYLLALIAMVATALVLAIARPTTAYLLMVGAVALAAAGVGYSARRIRWHGWLRFHITGMATSYIAMLTAFYVDNGPRLPLWRLLPPVTFWFLPGAFGLPLLLRALHRHTCHADTHLPPPHAASQ
jgi:uncharacterized membrane protein